MSSAIIGASALVVGAVGTGLSVYSSMQQGAAANRIAGMNAEILEKNAALQLRSDRLQIEGEIFDAKTAQQSAEISYRVGQINEGNARLQGLQNELDAANQIDNANTAARFSRVDASLSRRSAATLDSYAVALDASSAEKVARFRETGARIAAATRGRIAKAGLVESGSPLEVMGDTAANIELTAQDMAYEGDLASRDVRRAAFSKREEAKRSLLVGKQYLKSAANADKSRQIARMGVDFSIAGAKLEQDAAKLAREQADYRVDAGMESWDIAQENYQLALEGAGVTRAGGAAQQRGAQLAAIGTAINGAADVAGGASSWSFKYQGAKSAI